MFLNVSGTIIWDNWSCHTYWVLSSLHFSFYSLIKDYYPNSHFLNIFKRNINDSRSLPRVTSKKVIIPTAIYNILAFFFSLIFLHLFSLQALLRVIIFHFMYLSKTDYNTNFFQKHPFLKISFLKWGECDLQGKIVFV